MCILCKDVIYRFDFIDLANGNSGMNFNKIINFNWYFCKEYVNEEELGSLVKRL